MRERRRGRAMAFALGLHLRVGAESSVRLPTADALAAVVDMVMKG